MVKFIRKMLGLRHRFETYHVGRYRVRLRMLRDLAQFDDREGVARDKGISQDAFPLFGIVWSSSEVLAQLLSDLDVDGRKILEVGCGMALASHVLNARGADVTAMDIHPLAGELLASNALLNGQPPIPFVSASWSDQQVNLGLFDLIVASDVLYEPRHSKHLAAFLHRHSHATATIIVVDPHRGQLESFRQSMAAFGFSDETMPPATTDQPGTPYQGSILQFQRTLVD